MLAGKEYGTGSSRDWAAKGTLLLGVRAVIAESFERIHRSNLIGMGVLPLQFRRARDAASRSGSRATRRSTSSASPARSREGSEGHRDGAGRQEEQFTGSRPHRHAEGARLLPHGGILQYVLRQLASGKQAA